MSTQTIGSPWEFVLRLGRRVSEDEFHEFRGLNPACRFELTAEGDLIIMTPAGGDSSTMNLRLGGQLLAWSDRDGAGVPFDSSGGFCLPNGALRSPDAAWVRKDRWEQQTPEDRRRFARLAPDFVAELISPCDAWYDLEKKMEEYISNGVRIAILLDPDSKNVAIYRQGKSVERYSNPDSIDLSPEMPGFLINLRAIWGN